MDKKVIIFIFFLINVISVFNPQVVIGQNNPPRNNAPIIQIVSPDIDEMEEVSNIFHLIAKISDRDDEDFLMKAIFKINRISNSTNLINEEIVYANTKFPKLVYWDFDTMRLPNLIYAETQDHYILHFWIYDNHNGSSDTAINFSVSNDCDFQSVQPNFQVHHPLAYYVLGPKINQTVRGMIYIYGYQSIIPPIEVRICIDSTNCESRDLYYTAYWLQGSSLNSSSLNIWYWIWDTTEYTEGKHFFYVFTVEHGSERDQDSRIINVTINNTSPILVKDGRRGANNTVLVTHGVSVHFQAPYCPEMNATNVMYYWNFSDNHTGNEEDLDRNFSTIGEYNVHLIIYDGTYRIEFNNNIMVQNATDDSKPTTPVNLLSVRNTSIILFAFITIILFSVGLVNTEVGIYKLIPFFIVLYSKMKNIEILDNYLRGKIMGILQLNPGLNYSSIKEELQISNGTLSYHLKMMEKENFIKSERDGLYKRFYTVNSKKYPSISTEEQILGILRRNPGINQKKIAQMIGKNNVNVHRVLHKLNDSGLIKIIKNGFSTNCYLVNEKS